MCRWLKDFLPVVEGDGGDGLLGDLRGGFLGDLLGGFRSKRSLGDEGLDLIEPPLYLISKGVLLLGSGQGWKKRNQWGETHVDDRDGNRKEGRDR